MMRSLTTPGSPMRLLSLAAALLAIAANAFAADAPSTAAATGGAANALPPRIVAPTDKAQFRRFTLPNGMKVLLASDPNFNKSAASLAVATGQIDDPKETEGLAHFLEHMLFLGTEKYPQEGEYGNYIRSNGGRQ